MQKSCEQCGDEWATDVKGMDDLRAYDCIYHQKCSIHFRTGKDVLKEFKQNSGGTEAKEKDVWRIMLRRKPFLRLA